MANLTRAISHLVLLRTQESSVTSVNAHRSGALRSQERESGNIGRRLALSRTKENER